MQVIKFIFFFLITFQLHANHISITLQKALDKKLVDAKVQSLGGYQGLCININLKNLTKDSLVIVVEAGRRLNSLNEEDQDILIVKEQIIALKEKEQKGADLKGYSCQVTHHCPSKGAKYSVNTLAENKLVVLANYLNENEFDKNAEQEAVWSLSDGRPVANITAQDDSSLIGLREKISFLKGEPPSWYRILSKKIIYANGTIAITNLRLMGNLAYSNEKENYATLSVLNEKGLPVCKIKSEWLKISTGDIYRLDLPIKELVKGKYTVELRTSEKQLAKKEFVL